MEIYFYDTKTKKYAGFDVVEEDFTLPDNATTVEPNWDLLGLYYDSVQKTWLGLSEEEYNKENPATPPKDWQPSEETQQEAQNMLLLANLTQKVQEQQQLNAQMMLQIAQLSKQTQ